MVHFLKRDLKHDLILRIATQMIAALTIAGGAAAHAAEIRVIGGSAVVHVMAELVPLFEQTSGHKVRADLDGAIGAMTERIRKGEVADVVIVSGAQVDALIGNGKVVAGSRTDIAKVGIGAFVRKGARKPDISSVEAFKQTLISAKSIGYNDPAAGAPVSLYLIGLFERLGIASDVTPKTVVFKQRSERFAPVARGEVEIGFNQISEIIAEPGVDLVGPLPEAIRNDTLFAAGIVASGREQAAAREFAAFIVAPKARGIWQAKGFEAP